MFEDVTVRTVDRKLITVSERRFVCDIVIVGQSALCNGECLETGEKTGWITIEDTLNPAFSFGEYIKENF